MIDSLNIWEILCLIGAAQGIFLATLFLRSERYRRSSNQYLALLLITCVMLNISTIGKSIGMAEKYDIYHFLPFNWTLLIPFSLYYFILYLVQPEYKWTKIEYVSLIFISIYFLFSFAEVVLYFLDPDIAHNLYPSYMVIDNLTERTAMTLLFVVIVWAFRRLQLFDRDLRDHFSNLEGKSLEWLRLVLVCIFILGILWLADELNRRYAFAPFSSIMYPRMIGISVLIYWCGYTIYFRRDLFELPPQLSGQDKTDHKPEIALSANTDIHYKRLLSLMDTDQLYLDPNINMTTLAEKTELSVGYLSLIINQKENKNFFEFINTYRIAEVKQLMRDPKFSHFTLLGMAQEAGFRSKSTFNAVFKKIEGLTPSQYKKQL